MMAIAVYALPPDVNTPLVKWLKDNPRVVVKKYVLTTGQWQLWNIFAPNPLRRITFFSLEAKQGDEWKEMTRMDTAHLPWWSQAYTLKISRRLEKESKYQVFRERITVRYCELLPLPPGTEIRLVKNSYVIPRNEIRNSFSWWNSWKPEWSRSVDVETACPPVT